MSDLITIYASDSNSIRYYNASEATPCKTCYRPDGSNTMGGEARGGLCTDSSATFTFWGTQVSIFGRVEPVPHGCSPPILFYSIGSDIRHEFKAPNVSTTQHNVPFFESSTLPYGQYTLVMNVSHANAPGPYLFDYIRFNGSNPSTDSFTTGSDVPQMSTKDTTSAVRASGSSLISSGAIMGIVMGGVILFAAIILAFFLCCIRRRSRKRRSATAPQFVVNKPGSNNWRLYGEKIVLSPTITISQLHGTSSFCSTTPVAIPPNAKQESGRSRTSHKKPALSEQHMHMQGGGSNTNMELGVHPSGFYMTMRTDLSSSMPIMPESLTSTQTQVGFFHTTPVPEALKNTAPPRPMYGFFLPVDEPGPRSAASTAPRAAPTTRALPAVPTTSAAPVTLAPRRKPTTLARRAVTMFELESTEPASVPPPPPRPTKPALAQAPTTIGSQTFLTPAPTAASNPSAGPLESTHQAAPTTLAQAMSATPRPPAVPLTPAPSAAPTTMAASSVLTTPPASNPTQPTTVSPLVAADDDAEFKIIPPVIGIDFGTTHSYVSVQHGDRVEIIPNEEGQRDTPSWVSFTRDKRLVGLGAQIAYRSDPENTVFGVKRLIGCDFNDPELQREIKNLPFKVVQEDNKLKVEVQDCGSTRRFTPEEITGMVLLKMKSDAESYLGQKVAQAVVTIPAHFNDAQRKAIKDAGEMAGLRIVRIINESTAVATAYSLNASKKGKTSRVLIYRLGGGTFDVSVISIKDGESKVLATAGDTKIGGEDIDNLLLDYVVGRFESKTGVDIRTDCRSLAKLRSVVEGAKKTLSSEDMITIDIEGQDGRVDFSETLTRATFEELTKDLLERTMRSTEQVLADASLGKLDIDDIITVGGSTRIPKVQQLLQDYFGKPPSTYLDPEEAAAYGTGVQGAIVAGHRDYLNLAVRDINSLTLGIETVGGKMSPIIPRNTPIPASMSQMYSTSRAWQTSVTIKVFEGEDQSTQQNHLLGMFILSGIPPARRGVPRIRVTFMLDENGIMKVTALDTKTNNSMSITLSNVLGRE